MKSADMEQATQTLRTLPGDETRQILWRFADRFDLQLLVQSARAVARGPVARLVADGGRNSHEWTARKAQLLPAFDEAGLTAAFLDPEQGGFIAGPKNLALALVAFELAWVDAGAATCCMAGHLALAPIYARGTPEQRAHWLGRACPPRPGEERKPFRGAFALTEPLPFVGVETTVLGGKVRIAEWRNGCEPLLQVEKRGRFITNMEFANFATAAVDSADARLKGSCMVILEDTDPGVFERGTPARKLVHQLSSTSDPVFSLCVPASRIIGGYKVKDGAIVPRYSHSEIIEAVFRRTRITVGLMTAAKLLSAVEPVIRYQRNRFRGAEAEPGSPRHELGLQAKEDALHRLVDIWATGEAAASLGFAAARLFDELDPLELRKNEAFAAQGIEDPRMQFRALMRMEKDAIEFLELDAQPEAKRDGARHSALAGNVLVQFAWREMLAAVLCPACKLWNTGHGATMMREAVSLMGGYGITEDCPGFLGHKWTDAQLEATYEGPEAVQRRQLSLTMTTKLFVAQFRLWIAELRRIASERPDTGASALATAMQLWLWTLDHLRDANDPSGAPLYHNARQGVSFSLADALCWLLAARCQILDVFELEAKGPANPVVAEGLPGQMRFLTDLCHVQAARAAGETGRICAELVHGYASPSVSPAGPKEFVRLRVQLDGCLTGARLAKDRAATALTSVMIPETLDYPV
ncbi:MAG: acyl-CoA/acyl-ACP dehydrogenase [Verrucomicrobia bacterium]|nr:acyl-CoA/acyl-ACP dehydrogenase [Verrucomicrobiota bacterium]